MSGEGVLHPFVSSTDKDVESGGVEALSSTSNGIVVILVLEMRFLPMM